MVMGEEVSESVIIQNSVPIILCQQPNRARMEVARCIMRNMSVLISIAIVSVLATKFIPAVMQVTGTQMFANTTFIANIIALLALIGAPNARLALLSVFVATLMGSMLLARLSDAKIVIQSLVMTLILFVSLATYGFKRDKPLSFRALLLPLLCALIAVSVLNLFIRSSRAQFAIALCGTTLFSAFVVHDVHRFAKHCEGEHCCRQGTVALWLDFVNLFNDILYIQQA